MVFPQGYQDQDHVRRANQEQIRRIKCYLDDISRQIGKPVGETSIIDWIQKYAEKFREDSESA
jgi:hypothetical protein